MYNIGTPSSQTIEFRALTSSIRLDVFDDGPGVDVRLGRLPLVKREPSVKVRCVYNDLAELPVATRARLSESIRLEGPIPGLERGRVYPVLGVVQWSNGLQFLVQQVEALTYPIPTPAELFEVIDSSCSNGWVVRLRLEEGKWTLDRIGFGEFVADSAFMEKLMDNDPTAVAAYRRRVAEVEGDS